MKAWTLLASSLLAGLLIVPAADSTACAKTASCQRLPNCDDSCSAAYSGRSSCRSSCCQSSGVYAGVEATFLQPYNTNSNSLVYQNNTTGVTFLADPLVDFDTLDAAPRIWLGYQGQCWGVRGRYWNFDAERFGDGFTSVGGNQFRSVQAFNFFSAKTGDLEGTRRFQFFNWEGDLFLGARWAELAHEQRMNIQTSVINSQSIAQLVRMRKDGVGLTFGFDGRRPIGNQGLALKLNARGSVLWGRHESYGYQDIMFDADRLVQAVRVRDDCTTMTIAEIQAGIEWSRKIECFRAEVFTHVVAEYQWWRNSGGTDWLAQTDTFAAGGASGTYRLSPLGSDADLVGLAWAIGFRR